MKSTGAKRNVCPGSCVSTGAKFPVAPVESAPMVWTCRFSERTNRQTDRQVDTLISNTPQPCRGNETTQLCDDLWDTDARERPRALLRLCMRDILARESVGKN